MASAKVKLKDGRTVCLGRIPSKKVAENERFVEMRTPKGKVYKVPKLSAHFKSEFASEPLPAQTSWRMKAAKSLKETLGNTQEGCCVISSKIHSVGVWTANDGPAEAVGNDRETLEQYHAICGRGDNGCNIVDVLDHMVRSGLKVGGTVHKIDNYVYIDHTNKALVKAAIAIFGGAISLGVNLPQAWTCTNCVWDANARGSVGGHDVPCIDYDEEYVYVSTWGGIARITWDAFLSPKFIDEAYLELSPDWYGLDKLTPNGIDKDTLLRDLEMVRQGDTPPIPDPDPNPDPVPPAPPSPVPPGSFDVDLDIGFGVFSIPVRGTVSPSSGHRLAARPLPPWILRVLKMLCSQSNVLPPPWNMIAGFACELLPAKDRAEALGKTEGDCGCGE